MLKAPEETQEQAAHADRRFGRHLLLVVLAGAGVLAIWRLSDVLILAFGTALLALLLRGLARVVSRWTPIPEAWAVGPVVLVLFAAVRRRSLALRLPDRGTIRLSCRNPSAGPLSICPRLRRQPLGRMAARSRARHEPHNSNRASRRIYRGAVRLRLTCHRLSRRVAVCRHPPCGPARAIPSRSIAARTAGSPCPHRRCS